MESLQANALEAAWDRVEPDLRNNQQMLEACKAAGIAVKTRQCKASEIQAYIDQGADLIVTTSQIRFDPGIPVLNGLAFLTGIGKDKLLQDILDVLKD